jgi:toxin FitB
MILDSNVLIYSNQPGYERLLAYLEANRNELIVSLTTQLEVLGYHNLWPADEIDFTAFFGSVPVLPIDEGVITEAIRLRQQRKRSLGDSIIAAMALLYNQPVLTNNVVDFNDIDGLQVIALSQIV